MTSCAQVGKAVALCGIKFALLACFAIGCFAAECFAQGQVYYPEKEIRVENLPAVTARSATRFDVMRASLEIVLHDDDVCCGKDSALVDTLQYVDPKSLKDIAGKLQGRHVLSDGRITTVTAEYLTPDQVGAGHMIAMLREGHAALMEWNERIYVVSGVSYVESRDYQTGDFSYIIHKFLLEDARFSDERREVVFDRTAEDLSKVEGMLFLSAKTE